MQKPIENVKPGEKVSLWPGFLPADKVVTSINTDDQKVTFTLDQDDNEPFDLPKGTIVEVAKWNT